MRFLTLVELFLMVMCVIGRVVLFRCQAVYVGY